MPQPQPNTGFGQGNSNIGGLLGALLDLAVPNASANTQNQADNMNQQQQLDNHPIVKATQKALDKTIGEAVPQAIASGVPISHIMNHAYEEAGKSNFGGPQPEPLDLNSLLQQSPLMQNSQNNSSPQKNSIEQQQNQIKNNILGQLIQASTAPKGFMGRFGQALNNATGANASQISNLQGIATASGITPEQQYQQAGASELTQAAKSRELANQGNTPLQKSDLLAAQTAAQQKQIESQKAELEAEKANLQALVKTQGDVISHPASMLMGGTGLKDIHSSIQQSLDRIKELQGNLNSQSNNYADKVGAAQSSAKAQFTREQLLAEKQRRAKK